MDIYTEQTVDQVTVITRQMNFDSRYPNGDILLPQSLIIIGESAFDPTTSGTVTLQGRLRLPTALREIMYKAFFRCYQLIGQLVIPNSVETIGMYAFSKCTGFTRLVLPNNLTNIDRGVFSGCNGFTGDLILPRYLTTIAKDAFNGCSGFTGQLIIPNSVTSIGKNAFEGCRGFTGLVLSENLITIEAYAFKGCTGITELVIPASVKSIFDDAFDGTGLTGDIIINNDVEINRSRDMRARKVVKPFRFVKV